MVGKTQLQSFDSSDQFTAGQFVGMLVILTFIEKNNGIPERVLRELKKVTAAHLEEHFDKPSEDIYLMIDGMVDKVQKL